MTEISLSADCGNSPKNQRVQTLAVALESRDVDELLSWLVPGVEWRHPGGTVSGAVAVVERLRSLDGPVAVTIDRVTSHGKIGAANGYTRNDGAEQRFCHLLVFSSVSCKAVSRIESYLG